MVVVKTGVANWQADRLADLSGKSYVITGGNSGIGFEAARILAGRGGHVIIAARNPEKAGAAADALRREHGADNITTVQLDLASLASVRSAAAELKDSGVKIDALINNAGIMQTPKSQTQDGFETQFGTNHLGHFLWTALLFDQVAAAQGRIVTVSSIAHRYGRIRFNNLMMSSGYDAMQAYCQSKLANLVFALELHRRLKASNSAVASIACHPGYSNTALQSTGPAALMAAIYSVTNVLFAQSAKRGCLPTVLSAAGTEAVSGAYFGPTGLRELKGPVGDAAVSRAARNDETGKRLWEVSEQLVDHSWLS